MTFSAQLGMGGAWGEIRDVAASLEAGAWDGLWSSDHLTGALLSPRDDGRFEGWSILAGLAAVTERLRLGILVSAVTFRNPALLAKMAATVDQMSDGRLIFGIGSAWNEREHRAYGWEFPSIAVRSDMLAEGLAVIGALFAADGPVDFEGQHYRLEAAPFAPGCVQAHVPIMIGGEGERRTFPLIAQYGDMANVAGSPEHVQAKYAALARACETVGRDPKAIRKTTAVYTVLEEDAAKAADLRRRYARRWAPQADAADLERWVAIGPPAQIARAYRAFAAIGVDEIIVNGFPNDPALYRRLNDEVLTTFA